MCDPETEIKLRASLLILKFEANHLIRLSTRAELDCYRKIQQQEFQEEESGH